MKLLFIILTIVLIIVYILFRNPIYEKYTSFDLIKKPSFPIDVVYTWAGEKDEDEMDIRTSYNYELEYSLISVLKYLPWVNHIYILMNPPKKIPDWLTDEMKLKVSFLDHTETFPFSYYLPNTNSNAIETTLHNIPNLSEHFIYFNDDFFIGKTLPFTFFFTLTGKAIVPNLILKTENMILPGKVNKLNIKLPKMCNFFHPHTPISLLKSEIKKYHEKYPEYIHWIRSTKSRNSIGCDVCEDNNLGCPCQQQHLIVAREMYDNGKAVIKNKYDIYSQCSKGYIDHLCPEYLDDILENPPFTFCIQDTTDNPDKKIIYRKKIIAFFKKFYKKCNSRKSVRLRGNPQDSGEIHKTPGKSTRLRGNP